MAEKPMVRDSLSRIKEKIALGYKYCERFGDSLTTLSGANSVYEGESKSADGISHFLQFRLQVLSLYSLYKELGAVTDEVSRAFKELDRQAFGFTEDDYFEYDTVLELSYRISYVASPFWKADVLSGWYLFDKEAYECITNTYDEDGDEDSLEMGIEEMHDSAVSDIVCAFSELGCNKDTLSKITISKQVSEALNVDVYSSYDVESAFFCVYSVLLEQFRAFYNALSIAEQRTLKRRKLAKELFSLLEDIGYLAGCPSEMQCVAPITINGGTFLSAVGDQACQTGAAMTPLVVNYRAGLYGNIVDLYLFALDEEYHFLSDEYRGRSVEIFPNFVSEGKRGIKTA